MIPLGLVAYDLDGNPRIEGRVVLNTAPLRVACGICDAVAGALCVLDAEPGPGIPVMFHHGRVKEAEAQGFKNDCEDARRVAMYEDALDAGNLSVGRSLGAIGWLRGREQVYDPDGRIARLRKELEGLNGA